MAPKDPSPSRVTAASSLAPGFRFHPTDEELVSYYLKRKIGKKAFKVDAISELDLYKSEPWDLPEKSRIRSRDMEWYFFSPLDRKYANRSRTSRTTGVGYWKTTGKDRGVCRGGRTVGMKKTLVFHIGKAPKGTRTNWVMHEYRVVDEESSGRPQEAEYVVCRIFQKNGPGPQNGAQYGAMFMEEEWEEEEDVQAKAEVEKKSGLVLTKEQPCDGSVVNFGDNLFMQQDGGLLEHETNSANIQKNNIPDVNSDDSGQNSHNLSPNNNEDISKMAVDCTDVKSEGNDSKDVVSSTQIGDGLFEFNDDTNFAEWLGIGGDADASDYLELTDFSNIVDVDNSSTGQENLPLASQLEQPRPEEVFDTFGGNAGFTEPTQTQLPLTDDNIVFPNEMFGDPMMYFDASSDIPTYGLDAPDMVDELMTYFDATEDSLFHFSTENNKTVAQNSEAPKQTTDMVCDSKREDLSVTPELSNNKSVMNKHLESYLGAIPSPPALASEYPPNGFKSVKFSPSETHPSSSIQLATGTIRLDWSIHKSSADHHGYGKNDGFGKSQGIGGGILSMLISSDFCVSFLSVLFLGITFKLGLCICKV